MRRSSFSFCIAVVLLVFIMAGCHGGGRPIEASFVVKIEDISKMFPASGIFNTPVGATQAMPAGPGEMFQFTITAPEGSLFSFATMFAQSNDLFYAPSGAGINLYPGGTPLDGDVTSQIMFWDAGTEVNQEPGVGADQAPRQSAPNTGTTEHGVVQLVSGNGDGFTYPTVAEVIKVTINYVAGSFPQQFKVTIMNVSSDDTLVTPEGDAPIPLSPGVWVVHLAPNPLFMEGQPDYGDGLERLAEDGNPDDLGAYLAMNTGLPVPISPGVWVVHTEAYVLFKDGVKDYGDGLENLAEDGDPATLWQTIKGKRYVESSGIFDMPLGSSSPGPAGPGHAFQFQFDAEEGSRLSFATMFSQSNDLFFAPDDLGIDLFPNGTALDGTITSYVQLWDAGTEVNEYPGFGPNQAPRQAAPNTGTSESDPVELVSLVGDGFTYPPVSSVIKVTITATEM